METKDLPWKVEIPGLRKCCDLGHIVEPACRTCKHYSFELIGAPSGWCDLYTCKACNTSEEMTCDRYESKRNT